MIVFLRPAPSAFAAISVVSLLACAVYVDRAAAQVKPVGAPSRQLDDAVVAAWKKAGAQVGWMHQIGILEAPPLTYRVLEFRTQPSGLAAEMPAFRFKTWKRGVVSGLPDPGLPFGLSLYGEEITNAGLKELASLKSLRSLSLFGTKITDAELKELAKLTSLQTLDLGQTNVTGAGLKELAELKNLQTISLNATNATREG
jgi:hypothetical protein